MVNKIFPSFKKKNNIYKRSKGISPKYLMRLIRLHPIRFSACLGLCFTLYQFIFSSDYNIFNYVQLQEKISELEEKIEENQKIFLKDSIRYADIKRGKIAFERLAREQYYMHKKGETVFVVPDSLLEQINTKK